MHLDPAMLGAPVHERADRDFYPTIDEDVTTVLALLLHRKRMLSPSATIWECAAGAGDMTRVLERYFHHVISSDIHPLFPQCQELDFLSYTPVALKFDAIITNPPFGELVTSFMERGIEHIRTNKTRLVAMLARNELDCAGVERSHLFKNCPEFSAKVVLTWRPRWIKDSKGSPRHQYAWYIWEPAMTVIAANGPQIYYASRRDIR
jgi:hypothetical protein